MQSHFNTLYKGNVGSNKKRKENVGLGHTEEREVLLQIKAEVWQYNGEENVAQKNS